MKKQASFFWKNFSLALIPVSILGIAGCSSGAPVAKVNCDKYSEEISNLELAATLNDSSWTDQFSTLIQAVVEDGVVNVSLNQSDAFIVHKFLGSNFAKTCISADTYDFLKFEEKNF